MNSRILRKFGSLPAFDFKPQPYTGPSVSELAELRKKHMNPAHFLYYKNPLDIVQGKMQYLFDTKGDRYLDLIGGVLSVSIGHCHPKFVEAGRKQLDTLIHSSTIYLNDQMIQYAKELSDRLPKELSQVYICNSGGEANDMAVFLARAYSGNHNMISLRNSYHGVVGATYALTNLSNWKLNVFPAPGFERTMHPDMYRGPFHDHPEAARLYAKEVKNIVRYNTSGQLAGFIAEPIQGAGGIVPMPEGYLKHVYEHVRAAGGICISDEVQTGFGRLGESYWAFQKHGVLPDMVTMAKSIGNGASLAAVACRPEIGDALKGKLTFNTFGGNPLVSALGRSVLQTIDEENMQENCKVLGNRIFQGLKKMKEKYEIVGDIRGQGFMIGLEFVTDKVSKKHNTPAAGNVLERLKDHRILAGKGGLMGNILRFGPPYCINEKDVDYFLQALDDTLDECTKGKLTYF